jgi:3-oxoacyl-(acyl-carrier-protein) synthase
MKINERSGHGSIERSRPAVLTDLLNSLLNGGRMKLDAHLEGELEQAADRDTLEALAEQVKELFELESATARTGLYVASSNAGCQSAILFWQEVRRAGVAFANPELFPWTLANAPCGWLARRFQITGPNATYTGSNAALAAMEHAGDDLEAGIVDAAWILTIDFAANTAERTRFVLVRGSSSGPARAA